MKSVVKLHGFSLSNYYNKVKFILLEKGVPFEEVYVPTGGGEDVRQKSPLGKVPFIETEHGTLCESQVIIEYIEAYWPARPLLPADPWAAAKVRELVTFLDLHLELTARQIYPQAFGGTTTSSDLIVATAAQLEAHIAGFCRLARFDPFIAGPDFTVADCVGYVHLPIIAMATRAVMGRDLLQAGGVAWRDYVKMIGARPAAIRVTADQRALASRRAELLKAH